MANTKKTIEERTLPVTVTIPSYLLMMVDKEYSNRSEGFTLILQEKYQNSKEMIKKQVEEYDQKLNELKAKLAQMESEEQTVTASIGEPVDVFDTIVKNLEKNPDLCRNLTNQWIKTEFNQAVENFDNKDGVSMIVLFKQHVKDSSLSPTVKAKLLSNEWRSN
jgi:glutamyl/glutaminyl-tRNA synthetase